MGELKPKSFRIDEETAEAFKKISEKLGANQQETMDRLIKTYEIQQSKDLLPEMSADIEQLQGYTNAIINMYTVSLENQKNMREVIQSEFQDMLVSKDKTIFDLQNQIEEMKKVVADNEEKMKSVVADHDEMEKENRSLQIDVNSLKDQLADKVELNKVLAEKIAKSEAEMSGIDSIKEELQRAENKIKELLADKEKLELAHEKAMLELEKKLYADFQKKYEDLQEKFLTRPAEPEQKPETKKRTTRQKKAQTQEENTEQKGE